jgi:hypothetical protein
MARSSSIVDSGSLVVERPVVVELKCKEAIHPVDEAQLLSHVRLLNVSIGLLINFHVVLIRDGIRRMVNNYCAVEERLLTAKIPKQGAKGTKERHGSPCVLCKFFVTSTVESFSANIRVRVERKTCQCSV